MIIVIFGPPGSGKGTQSAILVKNYNLQLISVGALLRDVISSSSSLGDKIKQTVESGNLIHDDLICQLLREQLQLVGENFLLDGFPRSMNQAYFLTQVLKEKCSKDIDFVIELQVDDDIVISRLKNRFVCLECKNVSSLLEGDELICVQCKSNRLERRVDDLNVYAIQKRIKEYYVRIGDLLKYYQSKLLIVDASLSVNKVAEEIEDKLACNLN